MAADDQNKSKGAWLEVFCPEARCLSEQEIAALPQELKDSVGGEADQGLWLKVFCPDDACLADAEKGKPTLVLERKQGERGLWLNLFCPDGACKIEEDSDLP